MTRNEKAPWTDNEAQGLGNDRTIVHVIHIDHNAPCLPSKILL